MRAARVSSPAAHVLDPPASPLAAAARYGLAMIAVAAIVAGIAAELGRPASTDVASATDDAIVVELPPVEAATPTAGNEAPDDAASSASAGAEAPAPQVRQPPDKLPDPTESPAPPIERPMPVVPDPALALPPPRPVPPPKPVVATAPPQDAQAPAGAQVPAAGEARDSEAATAQRARRITLWQRSLMTHLETAKRSLASARHSSGTVKVAFVIDDGGHIVSEHVASGSGSPALDATALALVARAAPFPAPPAGTHGADLSFVVPVRSRR